MVRFMHAAWSLAEHGIAVERTSLVSEKGHRFYRVYSPTEDFPAIWMSPRAICRLVELGKTEGV